MWVIAAQFFSTLADNALLFAAISLLVLRKSAAWTVPALRMVFYVSFVVLAAFAGAAADVLPKGRVILATNLVKLGGCFLLLAQVHPLAAYAIVGFGAAAYSPAKYGILPELLPPSKLVGANAVMEVMTVTAILLGVVLGSVPIGTGGPLAHTALPPADAAICLLAVLYVAACACSLAIRRMAASNPAAFAHPGQLLRTFRRSCGLLWGDAEGQISLAVTSLFWAASAVLQFVVLRWAQQSLHLLQQGSCLQQSQQSISQEVLTSYGT